MIVVQYRHVIRFEDEKKKEGKNEMNKAESLLLTIKEELMKYNACTDINLFVSVAALETLFAGPNPDLNYYSIGKGWEEKAINLLPVLMEEETWNAVNKLICNKFYGNYKLVDFAKASRIAAARLNEDDAKIRDEVLKELSVIEEREKVILE